jgi:cysteinyl-tRNA synthetase
MTIFTETLRDDLNTPEAVAVLWKMMKDEAVLNENKCATLLEMNELLGLGLEKVRETIVEIPEEVKSLLERRASARLAGNYPESDRLRTEIETLGFTVKDTGKGQEVTKGQHTSNTK